MGRRRSKRSGRSGNTPAPQAARAAGKTSFAENIGKAIAARTGKKTQAQQAVARPTVGRRPQAIPMPMGGSIPAAAGAAVGAKALKDFQMANPNAPKMPTGIGVAGAPANQLPQLKTNPDGSLIPGQQMPRKPNRGKGGSMPTEFHGPRPQPRPQQPMVGGLGKGGQRPAPRPNIEMTNSGVPGAGTPPRPQRPGGKGAVQAAGGAISGKGGQRPSPSWSSAAMGGGLQAGSGSFDDVRRTGGGTPNPAQAQANLADAMRNAQTTMPTASAMMKKTPVFKMRSAHNTTFKEMGSGNNKKSTPTTRKARGGYSMPGFGNR